MCGEPDCASARTGTSRTMVKSPNRIGVSILRNLLTSLLPPSPPALLRRLCWRGWLGWRRPVLDHQIADRGDRAALLRERRRRRAHPLNGQLLAEQAHLIFALGDRHDDRFGARRRDRLYSAGTGTAPDAIHEIGR